MRPARTVTAIPRTAARGPHSPTMKQIHGPRARDAFRDVRI